MRLISKLSIRSLVAGGAALATLGAGVVAAHASFTQDDFGQLVKQAVEACQASAARTDERGIGECVVTFIRANSPSERNEPSPEPSESPRPEPSESPEPAESPEPEDSPRPHPSLSPRPHPSESPENEDRDDHETRPTPRPSAGTIRIIRPSGDSHRD